MISLPNIVKKDRIDTDFKKFDRMNEQGRLGNVLEPSISYDGSKLVYTQTFEGKTNISTAVMADRGSTSTQLTTTGKDSMPCWSADGKWILFTSTRDGDEEIYAMDPIGGNMINLSILPASADSDPSWSPPQTQ